MACTDTMFKDRHNATFNIFAAYRWLKQLGPVAGRPPHLARGSEDVASPGTHFLKGHRRPLSSRKCRSRWVEGGLPANFRHLYRPEAQQSRPLSPCPGYAVGQAPGAVAS